MTQAFSQGLRYSGLVGLALLALCLLSVQHAQATTWVVDASGKGNFTSLDAIYSSKVKPGDIVYMRGTFTTVQTLQNINGTKDKPITITSYPGTRAIVDGTTASPGSYQGLVRLNLCHFVVLDNIVVRNSAQSGISFYYNSDAVVQNCEVHDVQIRGIGGCGDNVVIRNNTVYNGCMQNYAGKYGSWSQVVSSSSCSSAFNKNWLIEYNKVYNSWGEGIDCIQVSGCVVRHNVVYDTYSVNIYMDNANGVVVDSNFIYSKNTSYYRTTTYTWPATGILVGAETWPANPQPTFNVTIKNNLLVGTNGISNFYSGTNWVNNVRIYYNTIWNPNATGVGPFTWPQQKNITPSGNEFRNNLIWTKSSWTCMSGQRSAWTISNNVWVGVKTIPTNCTDTSATITSLAVNSTLIKFASGRIPVISSPLTDFYLGASSPARGAGVALASVKTDYNGYTRASKPSVGFVEYGTQANSDGGDGSSASVVTGFFLAGARSVSSFLLA